MTPCRQVLGVYRGREWAFIEEHLHDVLGKQSRDAGDLDAAIGHFAAMLPCRHSPENWQAFYLRQFLEVVQQAATQRVRRHSDVAAYHMPYRTDVHMRYVGLVWFAQTSANSEFLRTSFVTFRANLIIVSLNRIKLPSP